MTYVFKQYEKCAEEDIYLDIVYTKQKRTITSLHIHWTCSECGTITTIPYNFPEEQLEQVLAKAEA